MPRPCQVTHVKEVKYSHMCHGHILSHFQENCGRKQLLLNMFSLANSLWVKFCMFVWVFFEAALEISVITWHLLQMHWCTLHWNSNWGFCGVYYSINTTTAAAGHRLSVGVRRRYHFGTNSLPAVTIYILVTVCLTHSFSSFQLKTKRSCKRWMQK